MIGVPTTTRAKRSLVHLQGESPCRERSSQPPVSSVASVAELVEFPANKVDEAYTENHVGRRGVRAP